MLKLKLSNEMYDNLKWIAQIFLPALATLYFGLARIWGFPHGTEIVGTISLVDVFLGELLQISSYNYEGDGSLVVTETLDRVLYTLELNEEAEDLKDKDVVTFKVTKGE